MSEDNPYLVENASLRLDSVALRPWVSPAEASSLLKLRPLTFRVCHRVLQPASARNVRPAPPESRVA